MIGVFTISIANGGNSLGQVNAIAKAFSLDGQKAFDDLKGMKGKWAVDGGKLHAQHYCQLKNRPHLTAISNTDVGDVHFLCNEKVGGTESHAELHMHGVHFQKKTIAF